MKAERPKSELPQISAEKLLSLVRVMMGGSGGREDDEHPLPPGPWDPVIRVALGGINVFGPSLGPHPEPWKSLATIFAISGGGSFGSEVALNPQPLPPRFAFLLAMAEVVIRRAELIQEMAEATRREGERRGIVGGYIARFVDDYCGSGFKLKFPFPGPRPRWFAEELDGLDLVVMAMRFEQAAKGAFSRELRQNLANAGAKLAEAGLAKLQ